MAQPVYDSDDDPDMKRAIELSLEASAGATRNNDTIELSSDDGSDNDEDLKRAMALSLEQSGQAQAEDAGESVQDMKRQDQSTPAEETQDEEDDDDDLNKTPVYRPKKNKVPETTSKSDTAQEKSSQEQKAPQTFKFMGMDRKKMEEERLARLSAKRKTPDTGQESQGRESRIRTGPVPQAMTSDRTRGGTVATGSNAASSTDTQSRNNSSLPFPKGVVKKTFAKGFPRTVDDITIDEVFQKDHLQMAVLSSFQWDTEWLFNKKIDHKRTNVCLIMFATGEEQQEEMKEDAKAGGLRTVKFCFPPMTATGNMHSKLQLLKFANYLRIVVPTGNLVPYDWGETGVMENMVFIIDLPLLKDPDLGRDLTPFGEELAFFLEAQGLEQSLIRSLKKYDFSETKELAFVHTIGTSRVGDEYADDWKRTGYCGLGRAITTLGLDTTADVELDYICASLGSVNNDLLTAVYYAAQGDNGLKEYNERPARGKKAKATSAKAALGKKINDHLRIYFPSRQTVEHSRGGTESAGTICVQSKWWNSDTFPRQLVHESENVRKGLLLHSKILLARSKNSAGKQPIAWAYVGSANLSESAWGRVVKSRETGKPKMSCRNWECGVVLSARTDMHVISDSRAAANGAALVDGMSVFLGSIPVPITWPSEAYGNTKTKQPWLFLEG